MIGRGSKIVRDVATQRLFLRTHSLSLTGVLPPAFRLASNSLSREFEPKPPLLPIKKATLNGDIFYWQGQ